MNVWCMYVHISYAGGISIVKCAISSLHSSCWTHKTHCASSAPVSSAAFVDVTAAPLVDRHKYQLLKETFRANIFPIHFSCKLLSAYKVVHLLYNDPELWNRYFDIFWCMNYNRNGFKTFLSSGSTGGIIKWRAIGWARHTAQEREVRQKRK